MYRYDAEKLHPELDEAVGWTATENGIRERMAKTLHIDYRRYQL
jgi:hypothetical protein